MAFIARGRTKGFLSVYDEPLLPRIIKFMTGGLTGRLQMNIQSPEGSLDVYLELLNGLPIICVAIQASRPIVGIDCLDILTRIKCVNCLIEVLELGFREISIDMDYAKSYYGPNAIVSEEQASSFIEQVKRLIEQQLKPKQIPREITQKTVTQPAPKLVQERPKPKKQPTIWPGPPSKRKEAKEEVEHKEREREQTEKGKEDIKKLEAEVKRAREEKRGIVEIAIIGSIDDVSRELLNPLLLVKLLTSMEFISGFTGSTSDFFKRICEISKSIPEAVYIARIRVGPRVYRVAAVNGKIVAAIVEGEEQELYGGKALEALSKEKTIVASIARVPIDMLPDKVREKILAEDQPNKQQNRSNQGFHGVRKLTQRKEEVNE